MLRTLFHATALLLGLGLAGSAIAGPATNPSAMTGGVSETGRIAGSDHTLVQRVGHRRHGYKKRYGRRYSKRYHRRYRGREIVDAPYAYVDSGRETIVDAPFTHVYVGRHGRVISAPFVELWLPY